MDCLTDTAHISSSRLYFMRCMHSMQPKKQDDRAEHRNTSGLFSVTWRSIAVIRDRSKRLSQHHCISIVCRPHTYMSINGSRWSARETISVDSRNVSSVNRQTSEAEFASLIVHPFDYVKCLQSLDKIQ